MLPDFSLRRNHSNRWRLEHYCRFTFSFFWRRKDTGVKTNDTLKHQPSKQDVPRGAGGASRFTGYRATALTSARPHGGAQSRPFLSAGP